MSLKVGDRVRVRDDFNFRKHYQILAVSPMESYRSKTGVVRQVGTPLGPNCVYLRYESGEEWDYHWSEDMLEKLGETKRYEVTPEILEKYQNSSSAFFDMLKKRKGK